MERRRPLVLAGFALVVVLGAVIGFASAPRGSGASVPRVTPDASFSPGYVIPSPAAPPATDATPRATATPGLEPTASTGALPVERLPIVRFVTATTNVALPIEIPPASEYGIGLSGRASLQGRGMLFYYPDGKGTSGFWMKDTHVDLDIAFVDTSMTVIAVVQMKADTDTIHRPQQPYMAAIEAPAGYLTATGVSPGAKVEFLFDIAALFRR